MADTGGGASEKECDGKAAANDEGADAEIDGTTDGDVSPGTGVIWPENMAPALSVERGPNWDRVAPGAVPPFIGRARIGGRSGAGSGAVATAAGATEDEDIVT